MSFSHDRQWQLPKLLNKDEYRPRELGLWHGPLRQPQQLSSVGTCKEVFPLVFTPFGDCSECY